MSFKRKAAIIKPYGFTLFSESSSATNSQGVVRRFLKWLAVGAGLTGFGLFLMASSSANAQDVSTQQNSEAPPVSQTTATRDTENSNPQQNVANVSSQTGASSNNNNNQIIRLEDTIRGSKEQPQILSIVPWQLPTHKGIDSVDGWRLSTPVLRSFTRDEFLNNLQILKEKSDLNGSQEVTSQEK